MSNTTSTPTASKLVDKQALQKAVAAADRRMGFIPDPAATAEKSQTMMQERGIKPEERFLSGEIIRLRHEQEGT